MRIIGGAFGGRRLQAPDSADIRPMRDQVRTALFNILGDAVVGRRFLDLYAGTGSVGLEALSRGAAHVVFVDQGREAIRLLKRNVATLEAGDRVTIRRRDVLKALEEFAESGQRFDVVFVGPPYGADLADRTLKRLASHAILVEDALVVTEVFKKERVAASYEGLEQSDERLYGDNRLVFYRRQPPS